MVFSSFKNQTTYSYVNYMYNMYTLFYYKTLATKLCTFLYISVVHVTLTSVPQTTGNHNIVQSVAQNILNS